MNVSGSMDGLWFLDATPEDNVGVEDLGAGLENLEIPLPDVWAEEYDESIFNPVNGVAEFQKGADFLEQHQPEASDHKSADVEKNLKAFRTLSPVSVLDGEHSNSPEALVRLDPILVFHGKRARNKRRRPPSYNPQFTFPSLPTLSKPKHHFYEKPGKKTQKKDKILDFLSDSQDDIEKRCSHCEAKSTPQWREGPLGPKTLCNACGMRYRTGRLLPEYRPAASPTFVPSLHSNSHRKVLEIRRKMGLEVEAAAA